MKLSEAIEDFLSYISIEKGDSNKTIESYSNDLKLFLDITGNIDVSNLNINHISYFIEYLHNEEYKRSSIIRKTICIKGLYKYLKNEDKLDILISDIEIPKGEKYLPKVLNIDQTYKLFDSVDKETTTGLLDITLIKTMYYCGLRVSELVNLNLDDIYFKGKYLKVFGKRSKERIVPFSDDLLNTFNTYIKLYREIYNIKNKKFFVHENGNLITRQYVYLIVKKYQKIANLNIEISPHTLRHSFATRIIESGGKLKDVQLLLGHTNITTSQIYTHLSKKKQIEEYKKSMKRD